MIDGDLFAIWAPDGGLAGAVVEVYQGDVVVIAGQPTFVRGTVPEWLVENLCTAEVADIADPPAGGLDIPQRRVLFADWDANENQVQVFYGSDQVMAGCTLAEGAVTVATLAYARDEEGTWFTFEPFQFMAAFGHRSWVFGVAPAGAQRMEAA